MVFPAGQTQSKAVIVAKDSDVLILLLYAVTLTIEANWLMKINTSEYVDVRTINNCCTLPQFHAITGCDTTSYRLLGVTQRRIDYWVRHNVV